MGRSTGAEETYSPEVVDEDVEDAEDDNEERGAGLGLETNDNHDTGDEADQGDEDTAKRPLAAEDEANEEEDEQNTAGELDVHLAVLLLELGKAGKGLRLADPRVGEDHEEAAHDGEVAKEEVEIKDQAVAEGLHDNNSNETADGIFRVLPGNDEPRADAHGDHVDDEEEVGHTTPDCARRAWLVSFLQGSS